MAFSRLNLAFLLALANTEPKNYLLSFNLANFSGGNWTVYVVGKLRRIRNLFYIDRLYMMIFYMLLY